MDSFHGCLPGAVPPLTGHSGSLRYLPQPSAPGLLLPDGGSPGCGHSSDAPVLGSSPGLRLPAVWAHPALPHQGSPIPQPGGDSSGCVLAAPPMVLGSLRAPGGGAGPSTSAQGPSAAAPLHHYHQNLRALDLTGFRIASEPHAISDSLHEWLANLPYAADLPRV